MKKILLSSLVLFSVMATAQNKGMTLNPATQNPVGANKAVKRTANANSAYQKTANSNGSAWFNQLDYLEVIQSGVATFAAMPLFPDSTIILGFTQADEAVYAPYCKAANYLDPSFMAQQAIITDKFATYTIDSVAVGYIYNRASANSVTDSLIIEVISDNHALDWDLASTIYQDIPFNYPALTLKTTIPKLKRLSIPLTINDTCEGGVYKQIIRGTTGIAPQLNSRKVGMVVSFKPGYTWTLTDTLYDSHRTNTFSLISAEQNGDGGGNGTDPIAFGIPSDPTSDMNMSYIMHKSVRYNINGNGWNGFYLPTYAYTTPFGYESHDMGYKLTVNITGVKELEQKGFVLGQNTPNPFNNSSTVKFQLAKDASSVLFTVTDVMGRIVSSEKQNATTGIHSITLGAYAAGIYYYSLNVDGNITTKKMIVE